MAYDIKLKDGRTSRVGSIVGPVGIISDRYVQNDYLQKFERAVRRELSFILESGHPIIFGGG